MRSIHLVDYEHEHEIRNIVLNQILWLWTIVIGVSILLIVFKYFEIGWYFPDYILIFILGFCILIFFIQKRISSRLKVLYLVTVNLILGIIGLYCLGFVAGTIFCLPVVSVIISLYYKRKTVHILFISIVLVLSLIAFGYINELFDNNLNVDQYYNNYLMWAIYISGIAFCFAICSTTVFKYRDLVSGLIDKINSQQILLRQKNEELVKTLSEIKTLSGLLPICSRCKKIRDEEGYWNQLENYIEKHTGAQFSHSICETCAKELYGNEIWYNKEKT